MWKNDEVTRIYPSSRGSPRPVIVTLGIHRIIFGLLSLAEDLCLAECTDLSLFFLVRLSALALLFRDIPERLRGDTHWQKADQGEQKQQFFDHYYPPAKTARSRTAKQL